MVLTKTEKAQLVIDTEKLKDLELPTPARVQEAFERYKSEHLRNNITNVEYLEEHNGRLLQRTFTMHAHGSKRPATLREVGRRYEGGKMVGSNVTGGWYMQPAQADDSDTPADMHPSGWSPAFTFIYKKNGKSSVEYPAICINEDEWLAKYPYCQWGTYCGRVWGINFFKFLCHYRANPKIELLIKAGYRNFVGVNSLNMKGKNFKDIFKVTQDFAEEYLKHGTMIDLNILRSNPWIQDKETLEDYKIFKECYGGRGRELTNEEYKFLYDTNQGHLSHFYSDYLRFAKQLAYPLEEKRYHYPKDIKKAHDEAERQVVVIENKSKDEQIKTLVDKVQDFRFEQDGYTIFPLSCADDLIKESQGLHHCVRTYVDRVARHDSLILFVRKTNNIDTPFVTLELVRNSNSKSKSLMKQFNKITQVYGYKDSRPDENTSRFVMAWKEKFKLTGWSYQPQ